MTTEYTLLFCNKHKNTHTHTHNEVSDKYRDRPHDYCSNTACGLHFDKWPKEFS